MAKFRVMASSADSPIDVESETAGSAARAQFGDDMGEIEYGRSYDYFVMDEHGAVTVHSFKAQVQVDVCMPRAKVTDRVRRYLEGSE